MGVVINRIMKGRHEHLIETEEDATEDDLAQSLERLLILARSPAISMELLQEIGLMFSIYTKIKRRYAKEDAVRRKKGHAIKKEQKALNKALGIA